MPSSSPSPRRAVVWLDASLRVCVGFPAHVRVRVGCELVCLHRWGLGSSWARVRNAAGTASFSVRVGERGSVPKVYRVMCSTTFPDVLVLVHAFSHDAPRGISALPQRDISFGRARLSDVTLDRQERRAPGDMRAPQVAASENVFRQLGFSDAGAEGLLRKATLVADVRGMMRRRSPVQDGLVLRSITDGDLDALSLDTLASLSASLTRKEA